jgi:hypothetical protein
VLTRRIDALEADDVTALGRDIDAFLKELSAAILSFRSVAIEPDIGDSAAAVDEFVSLVSEAACTRVVEAVDARVGAFPELLDRRSALAEAAIAEYQHRRARGYTSFALVGDDNEGLPHRQRVLKRAMSSALYLDIGYQEAGEFVHNIAGMVAAAAAMLFAIVVAVWAQLRWEMTTWPFIAVMVISYAIKDRIKELSRRTLGRRVKGLAPDVVVKLRVPSTDSVVGVCREWFSVEHPDGLDEEILRIRHIDHDNELDEMGRPESVMVYRKEVSLEGRRLRKDLARVDGLTDIIRFNLSRLRRRMDAPVEMYTLVHPLTRELVEVPCGRVYHLNIVLRTTSGRGREALVELERVRVVVDQGGIRRVERVYPGQAVTSVEPAELDEVRDSPDLV